MNTGWLSTAARIEVRAKMRHDLRVTLSQSLQMHLSLTARTSDHQSSVAILAHHLSWWTTLLLVLFVTASGRAPNHPDIDRHGASAPIDTLGQPVHDAIAPPPVREAIWAMCSEPVEAGLARALVRTLVAPQWCEVAPLIAATRSSNVFRASNAGSVTDVRLDGGAAPAPIVPALHHTEHLPFAPGCCQTKHVRVAPTPDARDVRP